MSEERKEKNPHDIIKLIGKPKPWRERASIILIKLYEDMDKFWEDRRYMRWLIAGLYGLDSFIVALLLKLIFG